MQQNFIAQVAMANDYDRRVGVSEIDLRGSGRAKLMLIALSITWGVTWPLMKIALTAVPPIAMRTSATGLGALTLLSVALLKRRSIAIPDRKTWRHIAAAGLLNIVAFGLFSSFAQLAATTSRVAVLVYTLPIWAALLARLFLGERLTPIRVAALVLCAVGLAVLVYPLLGAGLPTGVLLALAAGFSWAAGTVYMKWAHIKGDPLAVTTWQLIVGFFIIGACLPIFESSPIPWSLRSDALFGLLFTGIIGCGIAYALWFDVVGQLPATTASLGVLSVPVIGVLASMLLLGERPTPVDVIGFALIFAASACTLGPARAETAVLDVDI